ncbi:ATP-dependent DNA ligase, partial [Candidatus Woesearchaeota archaeon]|nr:ATP-dependent DNA ligase [Candidatus Woesearchaeota archaeon]
KGKIKTIGLKVGIPIKVMLGPKEKDAESAFGRVGIPCQAEYKYDGFRIQIHKDEDKILLFTRNLENVTNQFPEIVEYVKKYVKGKSFILDSEAVGFSSKSGEYLPFQSISQRIRRKYDIEKMSKDFPVELNLFDIVYLDGKDLLKTEFIQRRRLLEKVVPEKKWSVVVAEQIITDKHDEAQKFYEKALDKAMEGVMFKKLDAPYKPGGRVGHMVKMKPVMESLDLIIVGAEWGEGKRASWLTSFTLACIDSNGGYLEIGKVGTGIKELEEEGVTFAELTKMLKPFIVTEKGKEVKIKPKIVIEVNYEEIQSSTTYNSGFALRFPRFIRLRDRLPEDISTLDFVKELSKSQKK